MFKSTVCILAVLLSVALVQAQEETYESKPASAAGTKAVTTWPTGQKLIALTYDDGPNPTYTPKLMELLREKGVKATFYLLGEQARTYPNLVRQVAAEGHELGNHGSLHKQFTKLSNAQITKDLGSLEDLVSSHTGQRMKTTRPPYGSTNTHVTALCEELGYRVILWDVDTEDWRRKSAESMTRNIVENARDGSIILMHDRYQAVIDATSGAIDALQTAGYKFVTVSEMLSHPRVAPTPRPDTETSMSNDKGKNAPEDKASPSAAEVKSKKSEKTAEKSSKAGKGTRSESPERTSTQKTSSRSSSAATENQTVGSYYDSSQQQPAGQVAPTEAQPAVPRPSAWQRISGRLAPARSR